MKLRHYGSILLMLISSGLPAQKTADLFWGTENIFRRNAEFNTVAGVQGNELFVISSSNSLPQNSLDVNLDIYDKNNLEFIQTISLVDNKSDFNFEKLAITRRRVHLFISYFDRHLGIKILSVKTMDRESNSFSEAVRIDEVVSTEKNDFSPFRIILSPDKNYILIYHDNPSTSGNKVFNVKVLNEEFTKLWEKEIELNYKDRLVDFVDFIIDDNSTVYVLASINPYGIRQAKGFSGMINMKNTLFIYRPYEDKLKEFEFTLTRNWINSVEMVLDERQNLIATAYYTLPNDYKMRGFVLFGIDGGSGQVTMRSMVVFSKDEFKQIDQSVNRLRDFSKMFIGTLGIYPGSTNHMNSTTTEFALRKVVIANNTLVVAAEALRRDERCMESFSDQQMIVNCEKHFLYGDIILFFIDHSGELGKIVTVQKLQHSVERMNPYFSFSSVGGPDGIILCFNDERENIDNVEENGGEMKVPLSKMSHAGLNILAYDPKGKNLDLKLEQTNAENVHFLPHENEWLSTSELLMYSQKEKKYKFGKLLLH